MRTDSEAMTDQILEAWGNFLYKPVNETGYKVQNCLGKMADEYQDKRLRKVNNPDVIPACMVKGGFGKRTMDDAHIAMCQRIDEAVRDMPYPKARKALHIEYNPRNRSKSQEQKAKHLKVCQKTYSNYIRLGIDYIQAQIWNNSEAV